MDEPSPLDTFSFRSCHNNKMWPLAVQPVLYAPPPSFFLPTTCHRRIGHQLKSPGPDLNHFNRRCFDSINFYPGPAQARIFSTTYIWLGWKVSAVARRRHRGGQPASPRDSVIDYSSGNIYLKYVVFVGSIGRLHPIRHSANTDPKSCPSKEDLWDRRTDQARP